MDTVCFIGGVRVQYCSSMAIILLKYNVGKIDFEIIACSTVYFNSTEQFARCDFIHKIVEEDSS